MQHLKALAKELGKSSGPPGINYGTRPGGPPPPPPQQPPNAPGQVIHDGNGEPRAGPIGNGKKVSWQASGWLAAGCPPGLGITDGYTSSLGPPGTNQTDKARQRNEFLSVHRAQAGETWLYKWKYHLVPSPDLGVPHPQFFHLTQLFSREQGGFVIALSLANAKVHVSTTIDQKFLVPGELYLPSCPVEKYWGRTVCHRALVTWGPRGSIDYTVSDLVTGETLISYKVQNVLVKANGSIKQGLYRAAVYCPATAFLGDFDFSQR